LSNEEIPISFKQFNLKLIHLQTVNINSANNKTVGRKLFITKLKHAIITISYMTMCFKFDYIAQCFVIFAKKRVNASYDELVNYGVKLEVIFRRKSDKSVTQLRNKLKKI